MDLLDSSGRDTGSPAYTSRWELELFLGKGDGTFGQPRVIPSPFPPAGAWIKAAHLRPDGPPDVIAIAYGALFTEVTQLSVVLGIGDGGFQSAVAYSTGPQTGPPFIADFYGDHTPDVLVPAGIGQLSVLRGNGDGTLRSPEPLLLDVQGQEWLSAYQDFDGDGRPDLLGSSLEEEDGGHSETARANVLWRLPDGGFSSPTWVGSASSVVALDLNGDGALNLLALPMDPWTVGTEGGPAQVYLNACGAP